MEEECKTTSLLSEAVKEVHDLDVEEGEISDSASVEEISEEDFKRQDEEQDSGVVIVAAAVTVNVDNAEVKDSNTINFINNPNNNNGSIGINSNNGNCNQMTPAGSRVWTMRDMYKYQISRNYAPGLYNLAWSQAVQNKPLADVLDMDYSQSDQSSSSSNNKTNVKQEANGSNGDDGRIVIDVDDDLKEEGELEEGEIDLDSEADMDTGDSVLENDVKGPELEKQVDLIQKGLESVTVDDAEKSFEQVCLRLQSFLDNLLEIVLEDSLFDKDMLIKLLMAAIQTVNNVFCSMNQNRREQNKDSLSRLLDHLTNQKPLFSREQLKEIETMISFLDSSAVPMNIQNNDRNEETNVFGGVNKMDSDVVSENAIEDSIYLKKCDIDALSVESSDHPGPSLSFDHSRSVLPNSKPRGISLPLLDLHKDHDVDSLPSPTREAPPCLPVSDSGFGMLRGALKPEWPVPRGLMEVEKGPVHPYQTDAVKAVSSYQQKFGRNSFFMSDLPSPTPSEDGDNGEGDIGGEVSSTSSVNSNVNPTSTSMLSQPSVSAIRNVNVPLGQGLDNAGNFYPVSSGPTPSLITPVNTRDPRLRLDSSEASSGKLNPPSFPVVTSASRAEPVLAMMNSKKQKSMEEPVLEGPSLKRQKKELTDFTVAKDVQALTGFGGWLEDRGTVGLAVSNSNNVQEIARPDLGRLECAATSASSASIMKVNRNENLLKPNVSATEALQFLLNDARVDPAKWSGMVKEKVKSADSMGRSTMQPPSSNSILGSVPFSNIAAQRTSVLGQQPAGTLQTIPQTVTVDESAKVRMKRRDPRRALHENNSQKGGSNENEQKKSTSGVQRQEGHPVSSRSSTPPDIGRQFIKNLKNIGNLMSVTQAAVVPLIPATQSAQSHQGLMDKGVISEQENISSGTTTPSEDVAAGPYRPQKNWGDVEHLFDGFDDKQKAAIQKERTRRIEEQKKMLSARKLCLVLDLDHTLLNSAKFVEVDPAHDEILRKKEEVDREQPHRHLFRFPHMGMWTKLRPGVWNFLEKASKLFELHVYTMGNKLYATEMAKLLDPKGELFAGRVISRGDDGDLVDGDERIHRSKDLEGVLGMESDVLIIDDSVKVWPHNKLNLIVVERYIYFPCSRRQFGLLGPSLLELDRDERPEIGTLASSLAVIERIHRLFFGQRSLGEADVRNILASEQRKILAGCRIVFSRVFPVGEANPHLHPLWQTAEQFGASCSTQIDDQVTHVVANSPGTDKVNWALSTGRFVVHPGWVEASALLYRRANEHDFAIKP